MRPPRTRSKTEPNFERPLGSPSANRPPCRRNDSHSRGHLFPNVQMPDRLWFYFPCSCNVRLALHRTTVVPLLPPLSIPTARHRHGIQEFGHQETLRRHGVAAGSASIEHPPSRQGRHQARPLSRFCLYNRPEARNNHFCCRPRSRKQTRSEDRNCRWLNLDEHPPSRNYAGSQGQPVAVFGLVGKLRARAEELIKWLA
jgi:hypothetical protein